MRKRRDKGQKKTRSTNCDRRVLTAAPGLVCHRKSCTPCLQARRDRGLRTVHPCTFNTDLMQLALWPPGPKKPMSDSRPQRYECCMFVGREITTNISQHITTKRWTRRHAGMRLNTNATSDTPLESGKELTTQAGKASTSWMYQRTQAIIYTHQH